MENKNKVYTDYALYDLNGLLEVLSEYRKDYKDDNEYEDILNTDETNKLRKMREELLIKIINHDESNYKQMFMLFQANLSRYISVMDKFVGMGNKKFYQTLWLYITGCPTIITTDYEFVYDVFDIIRSYCKNNIYSNYEISIELKKSGYSDILSVHLLDLYESSVDNKETSNFMERLIELSKPLSLH